MDRKLSCVLFDLDNTLTDRSASIQQFTRQFFEDFHHTLRDDVTFDDALNVLQIGDGGGYLPKETMFQEIQTNLHWIEPPTMEAISDYWYRVSPLSMQLRAGVPATLEELQRRGYSLGMITNGKTSVQNATIDASKLRDYFSAIVISEASGFRKPDPQIFHLALSNLGQLPECAVYIGDHPQTDVEGARGARLQAIWFADVHPWPESLMPPHYQITDIPQLLAVLE